MMFDFIKNVFNKIMGSSFVKSVMTLSSGIMISQIINFVGMPIVGRIYTPASVGDYSLVVSNAGVISALACLGMMTVFLLPDNDDESKALCRLVTLSTVLISLVAVLLLKLISPVFKVFSAEQASYDVCLIILFFYIVLNTVYSICYSYANRQKLYKAMFASPIILVSGNVITGIVFGLLGWGFVGYSLSHIVSLLVSSLQLMYNANPYSALRTKEYSYKALLIKYKKFPFYQMPANLISSVGQQIPNLLINNLFSASILGMYSMAMKILSLPSTLLSVPINNVYFREATEKYNNGEDIGEFSFRILQAGLKIAVVPMLLLVLLGEELFSIFLGKQWYEAGTYAAVLVLYQLIYFCYNCLSGHFIIIRKNKYNLYFSFYDVASSLFLFAIVSAFNFGIFETLVCLSALKVLGILAFQGIFLKMTGFKIRRYFAMILKYVFVPTLGVWLIRMFFKTL